MEKSHNRHLHGVLLTLAGILTLSPDALLVRLVEVDSWTLIFWRGLLSGTVLLASQSLGGLRPGWSRLLATGGGGLLVAMAQALGTILFVFALRQTTVANTLVILAASPLAAALATRLVLREPIASRTWIAILAGFGGIALIFSGSLGGGTLRGDLCALGATCLWGTNPVIIRRSKAVNMVPATGLGGLLAALAAWILGARPTAVAPEDYGLMLLMGLVVLPLSFGLITLAPRYLPAPEVNLLLMLETLLGPYWVWLGVGETPPPTTLAAGMLILGTVTLHTLAGMRRSGPHRPAPPPTIRANKGG